uniref:FAD dependent oxidoreductase domain-containing protein n=1 Tax=Penicillium chrysogenum TaxID=5076 RepID=Q3HUR9_PENCH|nr:hypothetical protein [Penicillium chrysogenum]
MANSDLPHELLLKLASQVIQDPGIPVPNPTVSAWQEPAHPCATIQSKDLPRYTDCAIIGSGITGCSAAKTILESDSRGSIRRSPCLKLVSLTTGATSRNGGFLLSHAPQFYERFAERGYHLKSSKGALVVKSKVFWPYRLVTNIIQRLLERHPDRFSVETMTAVTSITISSDAVTAYPYVLTTPRGTVRAAKIFHCVNGFTGHLLPKLRGPLFPCRLSMSTQKPGPQWGNVPYSWLFHSKQSWDPNTTLVEQGLYWMQQNAQTGDLFVGGDLQRLDDFLSPDDSIISADAVGNLTNLLPKKIFTEGWTNEITNTTLSSTTAIQRVWSGIIGMTADQLPIVGSVPSSVSDRKVEGGEWVAAGFNGYGMSQAWLSGQAIALMALGQPKPDWLPEVYLSSEKRLTDKARMGDEAALASFFNR